MAADPTDDLYERAGKANNVDPMLLRAIAAGESNEDDAAVSPKGALGRMQLMPPTAAALGVRDPHDPEQAVDGAARLMRINLTAAKGDVPLALRLYQGGPNTARWGPQNAAYPAYIAGHYQQIAQGARPPATRAAGAAPKQDDNDPFSAAFGGGARSATTSTPAPAPATGPSTSSAPDDNDPFTAAFSTPPAAAAPTGQPTSPPSATAAPATAQGSPNVPITADPYGSPFDGSNGADVARATSDLGAGLGRGVRDTIDYPAQLLARGADKLGITSNAAEGVASGNAADKAAFEQQYGGNRLAMAAQDAGNLLAMAPVAGGVNGAMRLAGGLFGNTGARLLTGQLGTGLARAPSLAVQGAGIGAGTEAITGGDPVAGAYQGAVFGPAIAAGANAVRGGVNLLAGRAGGVSAEVAALAQEAQARGIPLRADQISTNPFLKTAGDAVNRMPWTGGDTFREQQHKAFNRAVAVTFGEQADAITPTVMNRARDRIGQAFNDVASRTRVPVQNDPQLLGELGRIETQAASVIPGDRSNAIRNQVTDILDKAIQHNGNVSGEAWQALTKRGSVLDDLTTSGDPDVRRYAMQIREALNDALERSAPPQVMAQLRQARSQWRAMRTVEDLVAKAPTGDVSAPLLMAKAMANDPQMAYTGGGELGTLARIGQQFLKSPPNSGSPERAIAYALLGGAGHLMTGLTGANIANQVMQSPLVVNRLIAAGQRGLAPVGAETVNRLQPYLTFEGVDAFQHRSR